MRVVDIFLEILTFFGTIRRLFHRHCEQRPTSSKVTAKGHRALANIDQYTDFNYFPTSLLSPFSEFSIPSVNPIAFAKLLASSNLLLASLRSPSISANSPKLCVATAHPTSHSSVLSGGVILDVTVTAFSAQARALETKAEREGGGTPGVDGGSCWAREMERLFTYPY